MKKLRSSLFAVAALLATGGSFAQNDFPNRPIRILCGFGVGGGTDVVARVIGQKMSEHWGQGVVVDNRTGAGGIIAAETLARANPDGHSLIIVAVGHAFAASYYKKLPYDTLKDFAGVTPVSDAANVLVVAPQLKVKTMRELIDYAKTQGGQVNFASAGISSAAYINAELFNQAAGVKPVHVPYKTMPDALTNIIAGNVQFVFSSVSSAVALIKANRLTALAVSTKSRSPALPDVATMAESGMPGFDFSVWYGLLAPAGTPKTIRDKLATEVRRILALQDVKDRLLTLGATPRPGTPEEFDALVRNDVARMAKLIRDVGIATE
jgi:tripartite-type tricarboxylate transporter receptor subunit TctC